MKQALRGWWQSLAVYTDPRIRPMLFLGFAAGLPFPLVLTTLSARLRQAGIDRTTIGMFSLVGLAYSLKFFWSPIVDRFHLPIVGRLGQRRSWMLLAQSGVVAGLVAMAMLDPASAAHGIALLATATAFCAATQDIAVDAYRIESVDASRQGAAAAAYQIGYQLALIYAGAGALIAASGLGWTAAYLLMAGCMVMGPVTVLLIREPERHGVRGNDVDPALVRATIERMRPSVLAAAIGSTAFVGAALWLALVAAKESTLVVKVSFGAILLLEIALLSMLRTEALRPALEKLTASVVLPLVDFFRRYGARVGVPILALVVMYRLNYMTMGVAANTFYLDLGYTLDQIALVSKLYGVALTLTGAVFAGWLVKRLGLLPTMLVGLVLLSAANLFYAYIAGFGTGSSPDIAWLAAAVSLDNVANGIAGTAFIAYMSSLTSKQYTATQYALFGTLWSLPAKSLASQWGRIVDAWGYPPFFVYTALMGVPALLLILWLMRRAPARPE
ncbi:PAT family beta-lactamase induction signal transducer AmpG [Dokdonella fugitiva]|uniref:PAT family beta-lactamase induction signal transducer AmpG n=1 Tax=Dokdonella fugitiva TaxID=328517 RepID=A0A839EVH5_9GAMM|nr:MFS transporter [Dokdonella fugitiva]MBA8887745.1 PAT family beta-lactamase induction signal transducer AmpG [Dokdonella fugitiva]